MKVGDRVVVWAKGHPHDGVHGKITEFFGVMTNWGQPRAMVKRDDARGFNVIGIPWLIEEPGPGEAYPDKPEFTR
jgi:hypothetical protein